MVTIKDVAKAAGVSAATVSRVLNDSVNVDAIKREKVMKAVRDLGYRPNEIARSLFKKSSHTVGLLLPSIANPFFDQIAEAVEETVNSYGYKVILCNTHDDADREKEYIENLILSNCDGFIVISDSSILDELSESYPVPFVALDRYVVEDQGGCRYPVITTDNYEGGRMAAQHLLDCGCKHLAHIGRAEGSKFAELRANGFADVLKENGMNFFIVTCPFLYNKGITAAESLFDSYPSVDGVFAGNDMIAFATITVAFGRGIRIPEQVQLIGFDDILFSRLVTPALTTISQSIGTMGKNAAELLMKKIRGEYVPNELTVLPSKLVERNTTSKIQTHI